MLLRENLPTLWTLWHLDMLAAGILMTTLVSVGWRVAAGWKCLPVATSINSNAFWSLNRLLNLLLQKTMVWNLPPTFAIHVSMSCAKEEIASAENHTASLWISDSIKRWLLRIYTRSWTDCKLISRRPSRMPPLCHWHVPWLLHQLFRQDGTKRGSGYCSSV